MQKLEAVHYSEIELIPGVKCDGTACLSERGVAKLLKMDQKTLKAMRGNFVNVSTRQSPYYGREIVVYSTKTIQLLIHSSAFINDGLRKNQIHIGKRAVTLLMVLVQTALESAIKQACGLNPNIQKIAQKTYTDVVKLLKDFKFTCSIEGGIATKKDIARFTELPISTINYYLKNHTDAINTIQLDIPTIRRSGSTANRMNGYSLENVGKIVLGLDSVIGIELKKQVFGSISSLAKLDTKGEIEWQQVLT